MISAWLSVVVGILILQYMFLTFLLKSNWKNHQKQLKDFPHVSVLVAARNEEKFLPQLLASLEKLDYPVDKLQILLADDQSQDDTAQVARDWIQKGANRKLISIQSDQVGFYQKNGKANALAVLAQEATGEYFFFTDADCEVPPSWIQEGVSCFGGKTGILIGITQVKCLNFFEKMQELEWWNTLGIVKIVTDLGLPTTGLGNNMVISRDAYFKSGGFEGIPFSLTEDLEISKAIVNEGFEIRHQVNEFFLVKTKAERNWKSLLSQRKRWMSGAMTLSVYWKILLGFQFFFFPAVLVLIGLAWKLGVILWGLKIGIQSVFLSFFAKKAGQKIGILPLLCFDFYQIQSLSLTILYYFWPGQTQWKARNYP